MRIFFRRAFPIRSIIRMVSLSLSHSLSFLTRLSHLSLSFLFPVHSHSLFVFLSALPPSFSFSLSLFLTHSLTESLAHSLILCDFISCASSLGTFLCMYSLCVLYINYVGLYLYPFRPAIKTEQGNDRKLAAGMLPGE